MFRKNDQHLQMPLLSSLDALPEKVLRRLEASWAGDFYREYFVRLDESRFAGLFSDEPSRPNVPINVLAGLETLKAGFGWSDEEMYEAFLFDLQVRYALGYRVLGEGLFDLRSVYNFRRRLSLFMQETGRNLLDEASQAVTDQRESTPYVQVVAFQLRTDKLRMDTTQIMSNIRAFSRLQLLVEVLQRVHRLLTPADQVRYAAEFAPYLQGSAGQYVYRIKYGQSDAHLPGLGVLMARLVCELAADYGAESGYQMLVRVFGEHFVVEECGLRVKGADELRADSLQAPDDPEATFRSKQGRRYRGYVANTIETCHPENPFQLIVATQTASNTTDDSALLVAALPELQKRTELAELHTDGGFNGAEADAALAAAGVLLVQTAIRGSQPTGQYLQLADFAIEPPDQGVPSTLTCPQGQVAPVTPGRKGTTLHANFDIAQCRECPLFRTACRVDPGKDNTQAKLRFRLCELDAARRRRRCREARASGHNLRSAVEATVRSLKHPFRQGKLPVRGRFRMALMIIASAAMVNVRRIHRYLRRLATEGRSAPPPGVADDGTDRHGTGAEAAEGGGQSTAGRGLRWLVVHLSSRRPRFASSRSALCSLMALMT